MNIIEMRNVVKYYGPNVVLNNINFHIEEGEICGLLGLNGAGKSTLMKIILQMTNADSGEVKFEGNMIGRDSLSKIGALIEKPPIYKNLSAYDNLKVKALLCGVGEERIMAMLNLVGLAMSNKRAAYFSTGMKMRLGIALALITAPRFLLLDEPTNGLDPEGIEILKKLLLQLSHNGTTILLSSHQLHDVASISDKIIILHEGKINFDGRINNTRELEEEFFNVVGGRRAI